MSQAWRRRRLPLMPALLFTVLLTQVPFALSIWYSLTNWKVVPPTPVVVIASILIATVALRVLSGLLKDEEIA